MGVAGQGQSGPRRWRDLPWFPVSERSAIEQFGLHGRPGLFCAGLGALFAVFLVPPISRITQVSAYQIVGLWLGLSTCLIVTNRFCYHRAPSRMWAFYVLVFGNVGVAAFICLAFPVLARAPQSAWWVAFTIMACVDGATEGQASIVLGIFHFLAPLATIPFFWNLPAGHGPAVVGPLTCALGSGYGYQFLARRGGVWRRERHEQELAETCQRLMHSERERDRLARDLHDSVGTALSLVALYGALAERKSDDPTEARHLATAIRDAARAGLVELRGVLHALPQSPTTLDQLGHGLAVLGRRAVEPAGVDLTIQIPDGGGTIVSGGVRTALIRIFQEALHNAVRHGRPNVVHAFLSARADTVGLDVIDDGVGFDSIPMSSGRGIPGMKARAAELGGDLSIASSLGAGTRVELRIPVGDRSQA